MAASLQAAFSGDLCTCLLVSPSHACPTRLHVLFAVLQEALWRLDEVLEAAMTGVRLGDGTTWVKHRGYAWVLGSHMASKLYPQGQGAPAYYQTRRPVEPHAGSTICLDKTYLLDTGEGVVVVVTCIVGEGVAALCTPPSCVTEPPLTRD